MSKNDKNILIEFFSFIIISTIYMIIYFLTGLGFDCPINHITHLDCPFCGVTRMIYFLLQGDFVSAIHCNVLVPILLILLIPFFITNIITIYRDKKVYKGEKKYWAALLIIVFTFAVLRNIPAFSYLRPIETTMNKFSLKR